MKPWRPSRKMTIAEFFGIQFLTSDNIRLGPGVVELADTAVCVRGLGERDLGRHANRWPQRPCGFKSRRPDQPAITSSLA